MLDDTLWLDESKEGLQGTLNLSTEFFNINDVQINSFKSELLVINSSLSKEHTKVVMGSDNAEVQAKNKNQEIRFLKVWIKSKGDSKHTKERIKRKIQSFFRSLTRKSFTIAHIVYLINHILVLKI